MTTLSLIIRSMDRPHLARALASVAAQDAQSVDAEVLVVAACGPDHRPVPPRVGPFEARLVAGDGRLPRPKAGNAGLEAARGRFITFLDDDDELLPHQFSTLLAQFEADPTAGLVHSRSEAVDASGKLLYVYGGPWLAWRQLTHGFFHLSGVLLRREIIERGVRFDEALDILEDLEFFVQCARIAKFRYVPGPVSRWYVEDGASGTGDGQNRNDARVQRAVAYVQEKWRDLARELADTPPARADLALAQLRAGDYASMLATLEPVLAAAPNDATTLNLAGLACVHLGRLDDAEQMLFRALAMVPGHAGIIENLALLGRARRGER